MVIPYLGVLSRYVMNEAVVHDSAVVTDNLAEAVGSFAEVAYMSVVVVDN